MSCPFYCNQPPPGMYNMSRICWCINCGGFPKLRQARNDGHILNDTCLYFKGYLSWFFPLVGICGKCNPPKTNQLILPNKVQYD